MAKHNSFDDYTKDDALSYSQRIAHFLDWAARKRPGDFVPYNQILKAVQGYPKMPRLDSEECLRLRRVVMSGIRTVLVNKYNREVVSLPGVGVRATVDDADKLTNVAPNKARRLQSARKSFVLTASAIDLSTVPNTPEYAGLKNWMGREVRDVLKMIGSTEFERKLLPPISTSNGEKK